jgi:hypothetical protein
MKKTLAIVLVMVLSAAASRVLAKGTTTKIVIEGPDLARPIEITNRKILANFNVWTGLSTSSTESGFNANAPSFIIEWSQGPIEEIPKTVQKYQVSFYSEELSEHPVYVVYYAAAHGPKPGYVYLPAKGEEWWRTNVSSIVRGVEGRWFHAWGAWENIARPLIEKAKATKSLHPT